MFASKLLKRIGEAFDRPRIGDPCPRCNMPLVLGGESMTPGHTWMYGVSVAHTGYIPINYTECPNPKCDYRGLL